MVKRKSIIALFFFSFLWFTNNIVAQNTSNKIIWLHSCMWGPRGVFYTREKSTNNSGILSTKALKGKIFGSESKPKFHENSYSRRIKDIYNTSLPIGVVHANKDQIATIKKIRAGEDIKSKLVQLGYYTDITICEDDENDIYIISIQVTNLSEGTCYVQAPHIPAIDHKNDKLISLKLKTALNTIFTQIDKQLSKDETYEKVLNNQKKLDSVKKKLIPNIID